MRQASAVLTFNKVILCDGTPVVSYMVTVCVRCTQLLAVHIDTDTGDGVQKEDITDYDNKSVEDMEKSGEIIK